MREYAKHDKNDSRHVPQIQNVDEFILFTFSHPNEYSVTVIWKTM